MKRECNMLNTSEKKNPREGAGMMSIVFLWWLRDVLRLGYKRPLTDNDVLPLLEDYKAEMLIEKAEKYWLDELKKSQLKNRKPRLWRALIRLIPWRSGLAMLILRMLWSLSFVFLPLCLWLLLKTLNNKPNMDMKLAFIYLALLGFTSVLKALSTQHYDYLTELWGLKLKVAVIGLVYKKVLSLNRYGLESKLSGNIINLVSNDAQKVEKSLNQLGMVMSVPLELMISLVMLWYLIRWEAFIGVAFFLVLTPFEIFMVRKAAKLRHKAAAFTDKRLAVMNEIISGIRAVKMYAWEWNFRDLLSELRRKEMAIIRLKGFIVSMIMVLFYTTLPIAALVSVTTLALAGINFSSFAIFTLLLVLVTIRFIFCNNLGWSVYIVSDTKVALGRIQAFLKDQVPKCDRTVDHHEKDQLLTEQSGILEDKLAVRYRSTKKRACYRERDDPADVYFGTSISRPVVQNVSATNDHEVPSETFIHQPPAGLRPCDQTSTSVSNEPFLSILEASCSWNQDYLTDTLCGISLEIRKGDLLAITGSVGSGKSSLLTAVLGELPLRKGAVSFLGKVAYVPQIPWVFSGTVRENILFGLPFNEERFQHVVHVCGLTKDLSDFTRGDLTEIGQRGVTLSGGQKARVGLARAVYSDADIYLLDDPLSAVDTKVGSKLFESCLLGELSGRIRLLATHQLQYLKNVDHIAVMEKGTIIHQGGYEELKEKGAFVGIVELSESLEEEPDGAISASCEGDIEKQLREPFVFSVPSEKGQTGSDIKEFLVGDLGLENSLFIGQEGQEKPEVAESSELMISQEPSGNAKIEKVLSRQSVSKDSSEKGYRLPESLSGSLVLEKRTIICQEGCDETKESEVPKHVSVDEIRKKGNFENVLDEPSMSLVSCEKGNFKECFPGVLELGKSSVTIEEGYEELNEKGNIERVRDGKSLLLDSSEKGQTKKSFSCDPELDKSTVICQEGHEKRELKEFPSPERRGFHEEVCGEPKESERSELKRTKKVLDGLSLSEKGNDKEFFSGDSELEGCAAICQKEYEEEEHKESANPERLQEESEKGTIEVLNGLSLPLVSSGTWHGDQKDRQPLTAEWELPELEVDDTITPECVSLIAKNVPETVHRRVLDLKESEEHKSSGTVTWRLYWKYLKEGLPVSLIIALLLFMILAQVSLLAPNWWLAKMAEMSPREQKAPITQVIHACLVALSIVVMAASSFFFYYLLLKAAEKLHNRMATATIKAPVLFFDTNPAGRILNRFSKDVGCMDDVLPPLFLNAVVLCLFSLCAILVPAATNYWLFLALLPIIGIYIYFGRYFLKSSRELKRIEAIRCSPVYSHITETVNGLEIVHSSNMNKTFLDRLQRYQDANTQAFFMVVSCNRWLAVRLDLLSSIFVTIVALGAILMSENSALAGLALTYALQTLDGTQYGMRLASEVENLMTSVERVMTYTEIEPEPGYSTETHSAGPWPNEGSLSVQDLSLVYFEGGPRVLKDVSFCVCSKEKVGVVGRTGAGKSSLVSALFRMPEPLGKILIDGVDIANISLQEARRSMSVITQDPVLFGGTLKRNMDPFSQYTDQQLWTVLEEVQLKTLVEGLPGQLNFRLKESGTNLSVGERQLVCLARALVQKSKIIIMDEATANVDFKTDRLIQEVIRHKFKDSTVLTIAHRLNTIMDYDKVLVLNAGRVVEFDKPEVLIRNGGAFAELVKSHNNSAKH